MSRLSRSLDIWQPINIPAPTCLFSLSLKPPTSMSRICLSSLLHCLKKKKNLPVSQKSCQSCRRNSLLPSWLDAPAPQPRPPQPRPLPLPVAPRQLSSSDDTKQEIMHQSRPRLQSPVQTLPRAHFCSFQNLELWKTQVPSLRSLGLLNHFLRPWTTSLTLTERW